MSVVVGMACVALGMAAGIAGGVVVSRLVARLEAAFPGLKSGVRFLVSRRLRRLRWQLTGPRDCRACGWCCSPPVLHGRGYVELSQKDIARLKRPEVAQLVDEGEMAMRMLRAGTCSRCAALVGTPGSEAVCAIYSRRPDICREFAPGSAACLDILEMVRGTSQVPGHVRHPV